MNSPTMQRQQKQSIWDPVMRVIPILSILAVIIGFAAAALPQENTGLNDIGGFILVFSAIAGAAIYIAGRDCFHDVQYRPHGLTLSWLLSDEANADTVSAVVLANYSEAQQSEEWSDVAEMYSNDLTIASKENIAHGGSSFVAFLFDLFFERFLLKKTPLLLVRMKNGDPMYALADNIDAPLIKKLTVHFAKQNIAFNSTYDKAPFLSTWITTSVLMLELSVIVVVLYLL
jgi:hypothetical protein